MKKEQFLKILKKYRTGNATEQERSFLASYYNLFEAEADITEMLSPEERVLLKDQIKAGIKKQMVLYQQKPAAKTYTLFRYIAAAAIVLAVLSTGIYIYIQHNGDIFSSSRYSKLNIPPGGNKAILTLANGKQIILTNAKNGELAQQGSTHIDKTADGQISYNASHAGKGSDTAYNTISTPKGGQYLVVLPDSSKVYLDAASSLRFPAAFSGKVRTVLLTGQAYFEVAHNKKMPFHVIARGQTVEVLGTHFNINAYDDEKYIKTTLLEGSVRVSIGSHVALLQPGQQSQVLTNTSATDAINVIQDANTDEAVAWKNGLFNFENADIKTIMRQFSRWYDVDITYQGDVQERLFSGEIHRNLKFAQALDILNYANVHFTVDGKKIIVSP